MEKTYDVTALAKEIESCLPPLISKTPTSFIQKYRHHVYPTSECVIDRDGRIFPLRGSHGQLLSRLAAQTMKLSLADYYEQVPNEYWGNMETYALRVTRVVNVRESFQSWVGRINTAQETALDLLAKHHMITCNMIPDKDYC